MQEIKIEKSFTTQNDIVNCIKTFYILPDKECHLKIRFANQIIEIDILLIAYLILFKEIKPNLQITLLLDSDVDDDLKSKLFQYLIYAFLMTGKSVFIIEKGPSKYFIDENSPPRFFQRYFTLSKSFMPILLIGKLPGKTNIDLYDLLFKEKVEGLYEIPQNVNFSTNDEQYYQNINSYIKGYSDEEKRWIPGIVNPFDRQESILFLSRLAFYNSLRQAKITRFFFNDDDEIWKLLRIDDIPYAKNEKGKYPQIEFFKELKWIFEDLSVHPPIYHFVFSQLLSSDLLPGTFNDENKKEIIKILDSLWGYTKEMVDGIKELSKNIREHACPPIGVITGKIYKEEKWTELKKSVEIDKSDSSVFDQYLELLKEKNKSENYFSFFDFNVIDLGAEGIIKNLKRKTKELVDTASLSKTMRNLISEDDLALSDLKLDLRNFLDSSLGNSLNQQSKKAIAHIGLLIFSSLINKNFGLLRASSKDCEPFLNFFSYTSIDQNPICFGTNYHIVLPITKGHRTKPLLAHPLNVPLESSLIEIKGIEGLLDYELISFNPTCSIDRVTYHKNLKCVYRIYFDKLELICKANEIMLWDYLNSAIISQYDLLCKNWNFVCVDFENIEINGSQLFRFIGQWSLEYPNLNLIVDNISTKVFNELIIINEYFLENLKRVSATNADNDNAIYWNEHSMILIYSYCNTRLRKGRFYFADVLWGIEKQDFYHINKLIKKTNFNSTTVLLKNDDNKIYDENRLASIAQSEFFHSKTTLLPFDLLLTNKDKITFFELNASVLLQNELILQENNIHAHD